MLATGRGLRAHSTCVSLCCHFIIKNSLSTAGFFQDNQLRIQIQGGRGKGKILQGDIIASNGILHIIDKAMDNVEPTFESSKEVSHKLYPYNVKFSLKIISH